MSFLAFSPRLAYALLAIVALLILFFYWLKPKPRRIVVASNFIWRKIEMAQPRRSDRWHWWLSLLVALAIGLSTALALTRPQADSIGGVAKQLVLVMDNSPSMAARGTDNVSRWDRALAHAKTLLANASLASEIMVLDIQGQSDSPEWVSPKTALQKLGRLTVSILGIPRMPVVPVAAPVQAYLFTDGVSQLDVAKEFAVDSVFAPAENVAITAFDARPVPHDPTRYEALVQLFNASIGAKQVRLSISGENGFSLQREVNLAAGETVNQLLDVSDFHGHTLHAQVRAQDDGFAFDDVAYAVVEPHRIRKVLLVTNGNRHLQTSLKLLPGIAVTTILPAQYNVKQNFDAVIFDRFAPIESPSQGAIFFRPPQRDWLPQFTREVTNPLVTGWDESQASIASVSWRDLHVHRAALSKTNAAGSQTNWVWAKSAEEGALVVAQNVAPRRLAIGFAVDDSNLAMQSGFPVFLGRSLDWLTQQPGTTLVRGLGHIEIPIAAANVIDHAGNSIATQNVANATLFNAPQPDVFTVTSTSGMATVIANVTDPKFSDVNRSRFAGRSGAETLVPIMPRFRFEPWVALLTIALALLAFEWLSFTRRMTI